MSQAVFDKATELVAPGAALTATASSTGIAINAKMLEPVSWVIYVTAIDFADTNETYVFTLEVSNLVGGTYTIMATRAWLGSHGVGKVMIPVSGETAAFVNTTSMFMRVTATLAGTTPSVVWGSFLTKSASRLGLAARAGDIVTWP